MKLFNTSVVLLSLAAAVPAATPIEKARRAAARNVPAKHSRTLKARAENSTAGWKYLNDKTESFMVDPTGVPDVDFDIGESYAGLMPISNATDETRQLYFWYFPTTGNVTDELTIWLNGGPGCSSLEGLLQENGPFVWRPGSFKPAPNEYTWRNLTNMLWVEQPVGTGFSQGTPDITDEDGLAAEFLGFLEQWVTTFDMQRKKVYVTGESYAGQYVPYIVNAMYEANNTELFDVRGLMIYDPSLSSDAVGEQIPAVPFMLHWAPMMALDNETVADLLDRHESCGYAAFLEENFVFPPKGVLPSPPQLDTSTECDLWTAIYNAASTVNPNFNVYEVTTTELLWDVLGFPGSFEFLPEGASIYFNRSDVQDAINAPRTDWSECSTISVFGDNGDQSPPTALSVLPGVIEKNERTVIGHGLSDFILLSNGTLLAIQNMTFNGGQGFSERPSTPFVVEGQGLLGKTHTERGLTYVEVELSGHMVPQFQPAAAYKHLQFLLGRIDTLGSDEALEIYDEY